ncbi:MAG TPA: CBS domain-containing protein [Solirubrobacteraceae bacterium]
MTKVREIMSESVDFISEDDTARDVARKLAENDIGAAPICGSDGRLKGVVTDRDLVVNVLAEGKDPETVTAGQLGQGDSQTVTIGADDDVEEAAQTMQDKGVRRLPVIDGNKVVGILSLADLADANKDQLAGETQDQLASQPPNN